MHVAPEGLVIVSVHYFYLQTTPPVTQPQAFPAPSDVKLQSAKVFRVYEEHEAATAQLIPL